MHVRGVVILGGGRPVVHVRGVVILGGVETSGACEGCGDTG